MDHHCDRCFDAIEAQYFIAINGVWGVGLEFPERELNRSDHHGKTGQLGDLLLGEVTEKESGNFLKDTILIHLKDIYISVCHLTLSWVLKFYRIIYLYLV